MFLKKLKIELPFDLANSNFGIYKKNNMKLLISSLNLLISSLNLLINLLSNKLKIETTRYRNIHGKKTHKKAKSFIKALSS